MTQHVESFKCLRQDGFDLNRIAVFTERECEINFAAVHFRGESLLRQIAIELLQSFGDRDRCGHLRRRAIINLYTYLAHSNFQLLSSKPIAALPPDVRK